MSEEMDIPFKFVGIGVLTRLANKLDPLNHVNGNDWRLLAEKLGYSPDEIRVIEEQKHLGERSTIKLLNNYIKKVGNSVEKVLRALQEMPRIDAYTILLEAVPKIKEFARQKQKEETEEENSIGPFSPFDYHGAWSTIPSIPHMSHYVMAHTGIPLDSPYTTRGSRVCHYFDSSDQCYTRSYPNNCFVCMSPLCMSNRHHVLSPYPSLNNMNPDIPGRDYNRLEVSHSLYPDPEISRETSDPGHPYREVPVPLASTIIENQDPSDDYGTEIYVNGSLLNGSDPISPDSNRRLGHVTNHVRNDISDIRNNGLEVNRNDVNSVINDQPTRKIDKNKNRVSLSGSSGEGNSNKIDPNERNIQRMKSISTGHQMSNVNDNLKCAAFRQVFNIRVFVTYANDSDKHKLRVSKLCNCLEKNKFFCFVDSVNKENGKKAILEDLNRKFDEVDFVLVCSSNKYIEDINAKSNTDGLHAKFIYGLITDEYKEKRNHRCVSVILDGTSQSNIPTLLQRSRKYNWPSQFRELLSMLSKPAQRITQHCARK